jgi:hypothetical protein
VATNAKADRILSLKRRDFSEVHRDGTEEVLFERSPNRVAVRRGRLDPMIAQQEQQGSKDVRLLAGNGTLQEVSGG